MRLASLIAFCVATPLAAQSYGTNSEFPKSAFAGGSIQIARPQGEFASNVTLTWGVKGFFAWTMGDSPFSLRADLGYHNYGSDTRRVPLGSGPLGLIKVDVNTTNNILDGAVGMQVGRPGRSVMPYANAGIGFANFFTTSSVAGSQQSKSDPFASSTNYSDGTFSKVVGTGLYIPVGRKGGQVDIGVRYQFNGQARYLTDRDISYDGSNNPVLSPRRTKADLLVFSLGFAYGRR